MNLLSAAKAEDAGMEVSIANGVATISRGGKVVATAKRQDGLYILKA
jgi:hypothetical protein